MDSKDYPWIADMYIMGDRHGIYTAISLISIIPRNIELTSVIHTLVWQITDMLNAVVSETFDSR